MWLRHNKSPKRILWHNYFSMGTIVDAAKLEKDFIEWLSSEPAPLENTIIEWREYDAMTEQVFIFVVGDWSEEIEKKIRGFLQETNKRILVSKVYYA